MLRTPWRLVGRLSSPTFVGLSLHQLKLRQRPQSFTALGGAHHRHVACLQSRGLDLLESRSLAKSHFFEDL